MTDHIPGIDVLVVDQPSAGVGPTDTDTLYLLHTEGPATPTVQRTADTGSDDLDAIIRAYQAEGGRALVTQGYSASGSALPVLADALDLLPAGPGQVCVPEVTTDSELETVTAVWAQNKVALLNGPANAADGDLATLAASIIASADGRGAALFADVAQYPDGKGGTNSMPWSITVAGLIARNDRDYHNPNLPAAGVNGVSFAADGVVNMRADAARNTLAASQVNTAKDVYGSLRNYGFQTLADLKALPQWWDLSGARTVMAIRARAAAIDEQFVFAPIDGQGQMLGRYQGQLKAICKRYYDLGALYGTKPEDAYDVIVDETVNPPDSLAQGAVTARLRLRVSPYARHVITDIVRRPITAAV
jgi:hypothetical protein